MRGVPTSDEKELEFRKHYLITGNVRASARQAGLAESTGNELAIRANADEAFVQARAAMYARCLPDAERMLVSGLQTALERLEQGPVSLSDMSDLGAGAKVTIQDPGPAYFRGIVDAYKAITANRKLDDAGAQDKPTEVHIRVMGPDDVDPKR